MVKYVLNPDYEKMTDDELFSKVINDIKRTGEAHSVKHNKMLKLKEMKKDCVIFERESKNDTNVQFDEIKETIKILKSGQAINTSSLKVEVSQRRNQTPILALLWNADLLIKTD